MEEVYIRQICYYKNYYLNFFKGLHADVKNEFIRTLKLIATIENVPIQFLKQVENSDGLYEVRVVVGTDIYRVFCFFDKGKLIILINGFRMKSKRTSIREIEMAERIKKDYFHDNDKTPYYSYHYSI